MPATLPEQALVARILAGEQSLWEELLRRFGGLLRHVARIEFRLNEADAEDVRQDVLLGLFRDDFRQLRCYRGQSSLGVWLRCIARRRCLDRLRMASRHPRAHGTEARTPSLEDAIALAEAIGCLSPRDQWLIRHSLVQGHSCGEIARHLRVSENTVSSWLFRARQQLRSIVMSTSDTPGKAAGARARIVIAPLARISVSTAIDYRRPNL